MMVIVCIVGDVGFVSSAAPPGQEWPTSHPYLVLLHEVTLSMEKQQEQTPCLGGPSYCRRKAAAEKPCLLW